MSFTEDLLEGIAQLLADAGVALYVPDGNYPSEPDKPIVSLAGLPDKPARVLALAAYPVTDDPASSDSTVGVQVHSRGTRDKRIVLGMDDAAFEVLHGREAFTLPTGIAVVQIFRRSGTGLGPDQNGRFEQTSNYYVDLARPGPHRTD